MVQGLSLSPTPFHRPFSKPKFYSGQLLCPGTFRSSFPKADQRKGKPLGKGPGFGIMMLHYNFCVCDLGPGLSPPLGRNASLRADGYDHTGLRRKPAILASKAHPRGSQPVLHQDSPAPVLIQSSLPIPALLCRVGLEQDWGYAYLCIPTTEQ